MSEKETPEQRAARKLEWRTKIRRRRQWVYFWRYLTVGSLAVAVAVSAYYRAFPTERAVPPPRARSGPPPRSLPLPRVRTEVHPGQSLGKVDAPPEGAAEHERPQPHWAGYNFDVDGDGIVSEEEARASIEHFDADHSGQLEQAELDTKMKAVQASDAMLLYKFLDADKDDHVTALEAWDVASKYDKDHDGKLSGAERSELLREYTNTVYPDTTLGLLFPPVTR